MITEDVAWLLVEACRHLQRPVRGLKICELRNQVSGWEMQISIKRIMQWLGATHTSIDLNGRDRALRLDLSQPLPADLLGRFDLVTNAGTTEHIVTGDDFRDQWQVFKSIHMIWQNQSQYSYMCCHLRMDTIADAGMSIHINSSRN